MQNNIDSLSGQRMALRERGVCVIIPTFNNAGTIADVVTRACAQCDDVIVVCDGCTDGTAGILKSLQCHPYIIEIPENRGKGAALKSGFRFAMEKGFAYAVTLDGDGQHFPEDIGVMLEANINNPGALIVGQRRNLKDMERSSGSKFANSFSNFWFFVQTGRLLKDTQSGYRLYPLRKLQFSCLLTSRYEAELELIVFAAWKGIRTVGVPVNVLYQPEGERVSHFRPVRDFVRISILNTVLCILALVYGLPRSIFRNLLTLLRSIYTLVFFTVGTMFILTPAIFLYTKIGGMSEKKKENLHRIICASARFFLFRHGIPGVRFTSANPHGEDFTKPAVIICNHQSHLDLIPILALTPKLIILTNEWVWNSPFYGYIIHRADFLPISRGLNSILPEMKELVRQGYSVAAFPEGTRSMDCKMRRFHQGAFHIARELNLDILPIVLYGAGRVLPKHGRFLRKWPVRLEIDRRITPAEQSEMGSELRHRASAARKYYIRRYRKISNKMEKNV